MGKGAGTSCCSVRFSILRAVPTGWARVVSSAQESFRTSSVQTLILGRVDPIYPYCLGQRLELYLRYILQRHAMAWTTPTLIEICIGLEINGYLPAEF